MVELGVLQKVTKPTAWVNQFVIIKKYSGSKQSLRVVLDTVNLNENILREHYYKFTG